MSGRCGQHLGIYIQDFLSEIIFFIRAQKTLLTHVRFFSCQLLRNFLCYWHSAFFIFNHLYRTNCQNHKPIANHQLVNWYQSIHENITFNILLKNTKMKLVLLLTWISLMTSFTTSVLVDHSRRGRQRVKRRRQCRPEVSNNIFISSTNRRGVIVCCKVTIKQCE